jgi:putative MATE family efflux protein
MTKDMTKGAVTPILIKFTIPLVLGNLFQLMYNAVDSMIVGKFVGEDSLAAVGTSNPLMSLAILFISGMCLGAGVLMGNYYGAKDYDKLKRQISSTMIGGLAFTLILTAICILTAPWLLKIIQTQDKVMAEATLYLRIIFCGLAFTFIYNCFASTLRALGDSRSPLYFLIISSVLNIFGDLFFVIVLKMGSVGCALSTVLSEALCCLFCGIYINNNVKLLCLGKGWLIFDKGLFRKTVSYGWVSAMQQATVQLGKIGIQAIVNTMGVSAMAAFAVVNRIDDFAYTPEQNIGHAMTSFLAQNKGAGETARMKKGFRSGILIEVVYGIGVCLVCFIFARTLMQMFVNDDEVITLGVRYLKVIAAMYLLPAFTNGIQGYFRGIGDLKITLISSFVNMGVRVLAALPLVFVLKLDIVALPISYFFGWIAMLIVEVPLLFKCLKKSQKIS